MSRNGSGTYSVPNTFVSGNTITASGHNGNWTDITAEMTNSVAADGQTPMTGPLLSANGTVGSPALTFAADPDTGVYHIGANNLGVAVNGAKVLDVATTGLAVTGTVSASGAVKQAGFALLPVGVILPYAGSSAPSGYLLCFGQSLLRTDYADLFAAIGTTFGSADGTHFTLPDLRGRIPAGKDNMGGSAASRLTTASGGVDGAMLGAVGGLDARAITTTYLPASGLTAGTLTVIGIITGSVQGPSATGIYTGTTNSATLTGSGNGYVQGLTSQLLGFAQSSISGSTSNMGSGGNMPITQPTIVCNYIIFAGI